MFKKSRITNQLQRLAPVLAAALLQACTPPAPNQTETIMPTNKAMPSAPVNSAPIGVLLEQGVWLLTQLGTQAYADRPANLSFQAGKLHGFDACNYMNGAYEAVNGSAGAIKFNADRMASTMMACLSGKDVISSGLRDAMRNARSYQISGQMLSLLSDKKDVLASFTAQDRSLADTKWRLMGLNDGNQAVVSQASTEKITIEFHANGLMSAKTSCGALKGDFEADAQKNIVSIKNVISEGAFCAATTSAYQEHQQLIRALRLAKTYERVGTSLNMRASDGATQLNAAQSK